MIIDTDVDTASVDTLVMPHTESHPTSNSHIPRCLAPLLFGFLAASIPPLIFSIISIHISLAYTLPTIVAFALSVPFHIGAWYTFCRGCSQSSNPFYRWSLRTIPRAITIAYTILLQVLWLASAITSSMVFLSTRHKLTDFCSSGNWFDAALPSGGRSVNKDCVRKTLIFYLMSMSLSFIGFVLLSIISYTLLQWHPRLPSTPSTTITSQVLPSTDEVKSCYFIIPLVHASLGFTLPLVVLAIDSFRTLNFVAPYPISTAIAYALTTHIHVITLFRWYQDIYSQGAPSKRLIPAFSYLLMLLIPWIASAALCCLTFLESWNNSMVYLGFHCYEIQPIDGEPIIERTCFTMANLSFKVLIVSTFIEVLIVGALILISVRNQLRKRRMRSTNSSSSTGGDPSPKVIVVQPQMHHERRRLPNYNQHP